jgi:hypothetical protein
LHRNTVTLTVQATMALNRRQLAKLETIIDRLAALQFELSRKNDAGSQAAVRRLGAAKDELLALLRGQGWI